MEDLNEAGGVYAVMKELADIGLLHTECMTVTGKTVGENIADAVNKNPEVIRPVDHPVQQDRRTCRIKRQSCAGRQRGQALGSLR